MKSDSDTTEHPLGIFSALLRLLTGESAPRIPTLAKFVEKDYEEDAKLVKLRREYASKVAVAGDGIKNDQKGLNAGEKAERADEWSSRRLDAGLYCLQTLDVVPAWLVAEDSDAEQGILQLLTDRDEDLSILRASLKSQLDGVEGSEGDTTAEMLSALIDYLG